MKIRWFSGELVSVDVSFVLFCIIVIWWVGNIWVSRFCRNVLVCGVCLEGLRMMWLFVVMVVVNGISVRFIG